MLVLDHLSSRDRLAGQAMSYLPRTAELHAVHRVVLPNRQTVEARLYHGHYRRDGVKRRARWIVLAGKAYRYSGRNLGKITHTWTEIGTVLLAAIETDQP